MTTDTPALHQRCQDELAARTQRAVAATTQPWHAHDDGWGGTTFAHQPPPVGVSVSGLEMAVHELNVLKTSADDWPPTAADTALIVDAVNSYQRVTDLLTRTVVTHAPVLYDDSTWQCAGPCAAGTDEVVPFPCPTYAEAAAILGARD